MMLDITSAPTTSACRLPPDDTMCAAVVNAYVKPEQAATRSYPHARDAPIFACSTHAVLGKRVSGVVVATRMKSISAGVSPALLIADNDASLARSDVATPASTM